MTANQLTNIPEELRSLPQWVVWRSEQRDGDAKPTKVPYSPTTGRLASVTDPATWGSFDQARAAHEAGQGSGVGFVFTEQDPYAGIDLDDPEGDETAWAIQQKVFDAFQSYAERSPSGRGLHIIVKGKLPGGRKRSKIEAYSSRRFFTMTGDVYRRDPVQEHQELLQELWAELGGTPDGVSHADAPERDTDDAIVERAKSATNGAKFVKLWEGDWQKDYPSQSDADQALANFLAFYTQNRAQIARMFRASGLGQRPKAQRDDYVRRTVERALDRVLPPIDFTAFKQGVEAKAALWKAQRTDAGWFAASSFIGKPVPPREWHVPGMIPAHNVTDLTGDGGTGKSLVALQLAVATVTGTEWLGQAVRTGRAIYLTAEDDPDELHRRLAGICPLTGLDGLTLRSLAGYDALLAASQGRSGTLTHTPLFDDLDARMGLERPALLVLDTRADLFGGEENNRAQGRQFIGMLRGLAIRHRCAVLLLSHPSVAGIASGSGTSGTTAWNNSVRSRLYLSRITDKDGSEPNVDARKLTNKKNNYDRTGKEVFMTYADGTFHAISVPTDAANSAKAAFVFIKLLEERNAQGRRVNANSGSNYAPKVFAEHPNSDGITKTAFKKAMEKLLADGSVVSVEDGTQSRRSSRLVVNNAFISPSSP